MIAILRNLFELLVYIADDEETETQSERLSVRVAPAQNNKKEKSDSCVIFTPCPMQVPFPRMRIGGNPQAGTLIRRRTAKRQ